MWRKRWVRIVLVLLLLLAGGVAWLIYTVRQVRPFYTAALMIPKQRLSEGNKEFLNRTSRFNNDVRKPGEWTLLLTDEQINGWFGVDLANNHPNALPKEIHDPRVKITPEQISFGVMVDREPFPVAASIDFSLKVTSPPRVDDSHHHRTRRESPLVGRDDRRADSPLGPRTRLDSPRDDGRQRPGAIAQPAGSRWPAEMTFETLELREGEVYIRGRTTVR